MEARRHGSPIITEKEPTGQRAELIDHYPLNTFSIICDSISRFFFMGSNFFTYLDFGTMIAVTIIAMFRITTYPF